MVKASLLLGLEAVTCHSRFTYDISPLIGILSGLVKCNIVGYIIWILLRPERGREAPAGSLKVLPLKGQHCEEEALAYYRTEREIEIQQHMINSIPGSFFVSLRINRKKISKNVMDSWELI